MTLLSFKRKKNVGRRLGSACLPLPPSPPLAPPSPPHRSPISDPVSLRPRSYCLFPHSTPRPPASRVPLQTKQSQSQQNCPPFSVWESQTVAAASEAWPKPALSGRHRAQQPLTWALGKWPGTLGPFTDVGTQGRKEGPGEAAQAP